MQTHHHDVSTEKELRRQSAAYTGNSAEVGLVAPATLQSWGTVEQS